MPKLKTSIKESMEKHITKEEWEDAIKTSKRGKAPGPDGLTLL